MNPPPPMPQLCGRATLSAKTVATAASTALPPASSTPRPTRAAAGDSVATTPRAPETPGRKCDPWLALEGTAETATRASVRARIVRRIWAESYPRSGGSCAPVVVVHEPGQPGAGDRPGQQAADGRGDVVDRLVADEAREALGLLDITRRRAGRGMQSRVHDAAAEARHGGRPEGEVRDRVRAVVSPACLHRHEPSARARAGL